METPIPFCSVIGSHMYKEWSSENQGHAPITITIDFKDDLTDNIDYMNGSMDKLNDIFFETLGNAIFAPMYFGGEWPTVDELRNRFVLVLSGHEESRQLYKRDRGYIRQLPSMILDKLSKYMTQGLVLCGTGQDRCEVTDL